MGLQDRDYWRERYDQRMREDDDATRQGPPSIPSLLHISPATRRRWAWRFRSLLDAIASLYVLAIVIGVLGAGAYIVYVLVTI